jgi:hypothetical protein
MGLASPCVETVGRTTAIAVVSAAPRRWGFWLRVNFLRMKVMRRIRGPSKIDKSLARLSFIHFAHWAVFNRMPARGGKRLPYDYILFQSNFNGNKHAYIEAFSETVGIGMWGLWGGAYNVPSHKPVGPFVEYILANKAVTPYYYSAYPHATTKDVRRALQLRPKLEELTARCAELEPEQFLDEYNRFLTEANRRT